MIILSAVFAIIAAFFAACDQLLRLNRWGNEAMYDDKGERILIPAENNSVFPSSFWTWDLRDTYPDSWIVNIWPMDAWHTYQGAKMWSLGLSAMFITLATGDIWWSSLGVFVTVGFAFYQPRNLFMTELLSKERNISL